MELIKNLRDSNFVLNRKLLEQVEIKELNTKELHALCSQLDCRGHSKLKAAEIREFAKKCLKKAKTTLEPVEKKYKPYEVNERGTPFEIMGKVELLSVARSMNCSGYSKLRVNELLKFIINCKKKNIKK
jgi:hypothetical protein